MIFGPTLLFPSILLLIQAGPGSMAPSKSCVDSSCPVVSQTRLMSSRVRRKEAPTHASLYSDLLSGTSVNNIYPDIRVAASSPSSSSSSSMSSSDDDDDDFGDVFGGPPKYAPLPSQFSAQLSFNRGICKVPEALSSRLSQYSRGGHVYPDTTTTSRSNSFKFRYFPYLYHLFLHQYIYIYTHTHSLINSNMHQCLHCDNNRMELR